MDANLHLGWIARLQREVVADERRLIVKQRDAAAIGQIDAVDGRERRDQIALRHRPAIVFLATPNNPTSGAYALERVEAIIDEARRSGLNSLNEYEAKKVLATEATALVHGRAPRRAPRASLDAVGSSLGGARVVVGVDTGLSHLAAALGRPTIGIYCDYDPGLAGLVGDGPVESLGGDGIQTSAQQVIEAAQRVMAGAA